MSPWRRSLRRSAPVHDEPAPVDPVVWIQRIKAAARMRPGCVAVAEGLAVYAIPRTGRGLPTTTYVAKGNRHVRRLRKDGWLTVMSAAPRRTTFYALVLPD